MSLVVATQGKFSKGNRKFIAYSPMSPIFGEQTLSSLRFLSTFHTHIWRHLTLALIQAMGVTGEWVYLPFTEGFCLVLRTLRWQQLSENPPQVLSLDVLIRRTLSFLFPLPCMGINSPDK